ncbi:hypothetical protein ACN47A_08640 [Myxococcus fulvus]|uniref:hypothetical protein n=1 Tax=Myxococcus fulvus TaxID=33 RepID=UPI003B993646
MNRLPFIADVVDLGTTTVRDLTPIEILTLLALLSCFIFMGLAVWLVKRNADDKSALMSYVLRDKYKK